MVGLCGISFKSFHLVSSKFFLFIVPRSVMEKAMLRKNLWCIYFPPNALNNIKEIKIFVRFQVYLLLLYTKEKKKLFTFLSNFKDIYVCVEKKFYNL